MQTSDFQHAPQKRKVVLGLTGGIGSGKSAVAAELAALGATVIDADVLAREVVAPGSAGLAEVIARFGPEHLDAAGALNRKSLGALVFGDAASRRALEAIVHPRIRHAFVRALSEAQSNDDGWLIVYAVPLLFEMTEPIAELDRTAVVYAPADVCVKRIMTRDKLTREEALQRINAQLSAEVKRTRADFVIENGGSLTELRANVAQFYHDLLRARDGILGA